MERELTVEMIVEDDFVEYIMDKVMDPELFICESDGGPDPKRTDERFTELGREIAETHIQEMDDNDLIRHLWDFYSPKPTMSGDAGELLDRIEKRLEQYESTGYHSSWVDEFQAIRTAFTSLQAERDKLGTERTMFIRHVLEIAKAAGYETNCEMQAHEWLLTELTTLRAQADMLAPVVEALEEVSVLVFETMEKNVSPLAIHPDPAALYSTCKQALTKARTALDNRTYADDLKTIHSQLDFKGDTRAETEVDDDILGNNS